MRWSPQPWRVWLAGLLLAVSPAAAVELVVEAPPELDAVAARIRNFDPGRIETVRELLGRRGPEAPIRITLAAESSPIARNTPGWVAGFAEGALGRVVIFPERTPSYPDASLDELFLHEIAHVFIARAAGHRPVPRWFNEGLAMAAAGTWGLDDRGWLTWGALVDREVPIASLDSHFVAGTGPRRRAYAISGAFMRDLMTRARPQIPAEVMARVSRGQSFERAFEHTLGAPVARASDAFWDRHSFWYRWAPLVTSSFALWLGIVALALLAGWRKRQMRARLEEIWQSEAAENPGNDLIN